jgi:hypothetical protein
MAANSKREQIIEADLVLIDAVSAINHAVRTIPQYSDLQDFAVTQFPVAAVVGGLPKPVLKKSGRTTHSVDQIQSRLTVGVYVYLMSNENADTEISSLLDDLWVALFSDPSRGGLVLDTDLDVQEDTQRWAPFVAFKINIIHHYIHDTGGI